MRYAILSDIHSNLEALERAVEYLSNKEIHSWMVLGDTVGYGANPNECFEWVLDHADLCLLGNHEKAVNDRALRQWFNPEARAAIEWTESVMPAGLKNRINELVLSCDRAGIAYSHGSVHQPEMFHYLMSFKDASASFDALPGSIGFVGHTHVPCCFCESRESGEFLKPGIVAIDKNDRYLLNPGSVGQPRDRDPRLSFGIYDDFQSTFEIVRLRYNNEKAAKKIKKAGLPAFLADRLL